MTTTSFRGLLPAFPSPVTQDGQLDVDALHRLVDHQIVHGAGGLVPLGGTGEYTSLSNQLRCAIVAETVAAARDRVPVIAGVLSAGLSDAIESGEAFMKAGASGLMVISPYYVKVDQAGIIRYFKSFQGMLRCPVVLYDNPVRSHIVLQPDTIATMADNGSICGMKASNTDLYHFDNVMQRTDDRFAMLSGQDTLFAQQVAMGARGGVLTSAVLTPGFWNQVQALAEAGDFQKAMALQRKLYPLLDALFSVENPGPLKAALRMIGIEAGESLAPLAPIPQSLSDALAVLIRDAVGSKIIVSHSL